MRVLVLGSGVIGVTSAYQLARDGHEVTVVDRASMAGAETSFASNGLFAAGHAYTWNSTGALKVLFKAMYRDDQAFRIRFRNNARLWPWALRFVRDCGAQRADYHTVQQLRLCQYSQPIFDAVVKETGIDFDRQQGGLLYLYRNESSLQLGARKMKLLQDNGLTLDLLGPDDIARKEPAFAPVKHKLAGAIYAPGDESGDVHKFTRGLADHCARLGVTFRYDTTLLGWSVANGVVESARTSQGDLTADAYVASLGNATPFLLDPIGVPTNIYPVRGYSLTVPMREGDLGPTMGGVDESTLLGFTRVGDRLRLTSTAEFGGYRTETEPADFRNLLNAARDLFPQGGDYDRAQTWAGFRPMTSHGPPLIRRTRYPNLYLNTGHGHLGWTIACGSARMLADVVAGRRPEVDLSAYPGNQPH